MSQAIKIVPTVPNYGARGTYLGYNLSTASTGSNIPDTAVPGDFIFYIGSGFDAGVSTNPGAVPNANPIGFKGSVLATGTDPSTGSDETRGAIYVNDFPLPVLYQTNDVWNGASGNAQMYLAFGIRDQNLLEIGATCRMIRYYATANAYNGTNGANASYGWAKCSTFAGYLVPPGRFVIELYIAQSADDEADTLDYAFADTVSSAAPPAGSYVTNSGSAGYYNPPRSGFYRHDHLSQMKAGAGSIAWYRIFNSGERVDSESTMAISSVSGGPVFVGVATVEVEFYV